MAALRVVLAGVAHPHLGTLRSTLVRAAGERGIETVGFLDTNPGDRQAEPHTNLLRREGVPEFHSVEELIALSPDAAIVCPDKASTAAVVCPLLEAGIACALEKPACHTYADAVRIADAAKRSGAKLAVNWPIAWFPAFNKAKALCDSGEIGEIMRVTYRSPATWGPYSYAPDGVLPPDEFLGATWWYHKEQGGGSILDYACYGAALATWFFGKRAERAWGAAKNFTSPAFDIEDFSAMILDFGNGIGLLEGSWSTYNCGEVPSGPVIHGKEGTIVCDRHSNLVRIYKTRSHPPAAPTEVVECPRTVDGFDFGTNFYRHITENAPLHPLLTPELNLSVMAALEAGRTAADGGVPLNR